MFRALFERWMARRRMILVSQLLAEVFDVEPVRAQR
jgi:hypothetical protein